MTEAFDPYRKWLGIPVQDQPPHHYRLLGIELFEADPEVIANAVDGRMAQVKNFQIGKYSEHSQRLLNEIAAAKICLLNPEKQANYDRQLRERQGTWDESTNPHLPLSQGEREDPPAPPIISVPTAEPPLYLSRRRRKRSPWPIVLLLAGIAAAAMIVLLYMLL